MYTLYVGISVEPRHVTAFEFDTILEAEHAFKILHEANKDVYLAIEKTIDGTRIRTVNF